MCRTYMCPPPPIPLYVTYNTNPSGTSGGWTPLPEIHHPWSWGGGWCILTTLYWWGAGCRTVNQFHPPERESSTSRWNYLLFTPWHLGQCQDESHWGPPKGKKFHSRISAYCGGFPPPVSPQFPSGVGAWSETKYLSASLSLTAPPPPTSHSSKLYSLGNCT